MSTGLLLGVCYCNVLVQYLWIKGYCFVLVFVMIMVQYICVQSYCCVCVTVIFVAVYLDTGLRLCVCVFVMCLCGTFGYRLIVVCLLL